MTTFSSAGAFATFLEERALAIEAAQHAGLERGAATIEHEAKKLIGEEHDVAAGPFPAWPSLSSATLEGFHHQNGKHIPGKIELGYSPPDNPLLRDGSLQESIQSTVEGNEAVVGSDSDVAVYQELGTPGAIYPIPPRSFLGRAGFTMAHKVVDQIAGRIVGALRGTSTRND